MFIYSAITQQCNYYSLTAYHFFGGNLTIDQCTESLNERKKKHVNATEQNADCGILLCRSATLDSTMIWTVIKPDVLARHRDYNTKRCDDDDRGRYKSNPHLIIIKWLFIYLICTYTVLITDILADVPEVTIKRHCRPFADFYGVKAAISNYCYELQSIKEQLVMDE